MAPGTRKNLARNSRRATRATGSQRTSANASDSAQPQTSRIHSTTSYSQVLGEGWNIDDIDLNAVDEDTLRSAMLSIYKSLQLGLSFEQINQALMEEISHNLNEIEFYRAGADYYSTQAERLRAARAYESRLSPAERDRLYERWPLNAQIRSKAQEFAERRLLNEYEELKNAVEQLEKGL